MQIINHFLDLQEVVVVVVHSVNVINDRIKEVPDNFLEGFQPYLEDTLVNIRNVIIGDLVLAKLRLYLSIQNFLLILDECIIKILQFSVLQDLMYF